MPGKFLPLVPIDRLKEVQASDDMNEYYDLLCQPLHEELYKRQDFSFFEELTDGQQLMVCYDYVQNHVLQGGFIQLIQNGYVNMLAPMPGWLSTIGDEQMAKLIDDVLKVYVLNRDILDKETTPEEFAHLYEQLPVFGPLGKRFEAQHPHTVSKMLEYATHHIEEFARVIG